MGAKLWSDEELCKAVQESHTWVAVLKRLGLQHESATTRIRIQKRVQMLGLDTSHFTRRIWTDESLRQAILTAVSWSEVFRNLGYNTINGRNIGIIKQRVLELGLQSPPGYPRGSRSRVATSDLFKMGPDRNGILLKRRLKQEGLLPDVCALCGQGPEWKGQPLVLQLDHINGNRKDNRLENLRILCPNCHTQTETFGSRRFKKSEPPKKNRHAPHPWSRKVERPSKEDLEKMVWEMPTSEIAKQYGVSDHAVAKWCKVYGISKPPRGYWNKVYAGVPPAIGV